MSRLQHALHALPPGSIVTQALYDSNSQLNNLIDEQRSQEILAIKRHQIRTGKSWAAR